MSNYPRIPPADGPECPRCGCRDAEILQWPPEEKQTWWPAGIARCRHCRLPFRFHQVPSEPEPPDDANGNGQAKAQARESYPLEEPTRYPVRACPQCGSPSTAVTSSPRQKPGQSRIRHHRCKGCGATFKSVDDRDSFTGSVKRP